MQGLLPRSSQLSAVLLKAWPQDSVCFAKEGA